MSCVIDRLLSGLCVSSLISCTAEHNGKHRQALWQRCFSLCVRRLQQALEEESLLTSAIRTNGTLGSRRGATQARAPSQWGAWCQSPICRRSPTATTTASDSCRFERCRCSTVVAWGPHEPNLQSLERVTFQHLCLSLETPDKLQHTQCHSHWCLFTSLQNCSPCQPSALEQLQALSLPAQRQTAA